MFNTQLRKINLISPEPEILREASDILLRGGLVAFPTETVYGLGANALDASAVQKIYVAKGRPSNNPLIVHVADSAAAREWVQAWPETAARLSAAFWPGPLTMVLPKSKKIPDAVSAGGPTVAVRSPNHAVALALLTAAGIPIAAPSANRSMEVSPTCAAHVLKSLGGRVELILDGGSCQGGLESTVLDLATNPPKLLRPGLISVAQIEAVIGRIECTRPVSQANNNSVAMLSPGLQERHYAPRATLELAQGSGLDRVEVFLQQDRRVGWLTHTHTAAAKTNSALRVVELPADPVGYGAGLYAALHSLDDALVDNIVVAEFPKSDEWLAIADRLKRASHPNHND